MRAKEIFDKLGDYQNLPKKITELNHEIHELMKALNENCIHLAGVIHGAALSGLPKSKQLPDPVYKSFLETEKLNAVYQDKIREIAMEIMDIINDKSMIDEALNTLDAQERTIVELRCIKGYSWSKIAELTSYSERQCRNIKDKAMSVLINKLS